MLANKNERKVSCINKPGTAPKSAAPVRPKISKVLLFCGFLVNKFVTNKSLVKKYRNFSKIHGTQCRDSMVRYMLSEKILRISSDNSPPPSSPPSILELRNDKRRNVLTHGRVNFSQSVTSTFLQGGGRRGLNSRYYWWWGINKKDPILNSNYFDKCLSNKCLIYVRKYHVKTLFRISGEWATSWNNLVPWKFRFPQQYEQCIVLRYWKKQRPL